MPSPPPRVPGAGQPGENPHRSVCPSPPPRRAAAARRARSRRHGGGNLLSPRVEGGKARSPLAQARAPFCGLRAGRSPFPGEGAGPRRELRGKGDSRRRYGAPPLSSAWSRAPGRCQRRRRPGGLLPPRTLAEHRRCPQPLRPPHSNAAPHLTGGLSSLRTATATERETAALTRGTGRKRCS